MSRLFRLLQERFKAHRATITGRKSPMPKGPRRASQRINTVNEKPLHAALKEWYGEPGDQFEVSVDGFLVDIVRGKLLIEIQTRNFAAIKQKITKLTLHHPVRLVYPIAQLKWIVRLADSGQDDLGRRKSPKRGVFEDVFGELVSFPTLLCNPNFTIEVLLIQEKDIRRQSSRGWRRKEWVTQQRQLLNVVQRRVFKTPADMSALIPSAMAEPFTTSELASAIGKPRSLGQQMAYCLREMGAIVPVGKRGNAILYKRVVA
jgi:hypothetical protein